MISSRFVSQIRANLNFWQQETNALSDTNLAVFDNERHNLFTAVEFGLQVDETGHEAAVLVAQLFGLIERRGYWREWTPVLEQAISCCPPEEPELKAKLLNQLGFLHRLNLDLAASVETHLQVIDFLRYGRESYELGRAHFNLGNTYYVMHQYEKAETHAKQALSINQNLGPSPSAIKPGGILNLLGLIATAQGSFRKAITLFQEAIHHWKNSQELTYLALTWSNLGLAYLESRKFEQALRCFDKAEAILNNTITDLSRLSIGINRGLVYDRQKKWQQAEKIYRDVFTNFLENSGDLYNQALIANHLGRVLFHQGKYIEAEASLLESIRLWIKINDDQMRASSLGYLADVLTAKGELEMALSHYNEATRLLSHYPNDIWVQERLNQIMVNKAEAQSKLSSSTTDNTLKS